MLQVIDLALGYGDVPVLEGAGLTVAAGQFVSLAGPSGSGKSSLLRAVLGLTRPSAGRIECEARPEQIGIMFQDDLLLPWRRVVENVSLGLRFRGVDKAQAVRESEVWLERLGLAGLGRRWPRELSGGQRKRVALAQSLVLKPRLLLLDEPFSALDAITRARLTQDLVGMVEQEGISVLLVTHDLEEALALSDVVYLLSQGPRARMVQRYEVPIARPRDVVGARTDPAFPALLARLWNDLSDAMGEQGMRHVA